MPQEILNIAEPTHKEYPEIHLDQILLRRREKQSCKGWLDRWYLPNIPYDDIAQNKILGDGIDLFDYYLTNRQVNRLREALSTNTTLTFV